MPNVERLDYQSHSSYLVIIELCVQVIKHVIGVRCESFDGRHLYLVSSCIQEKFGELIISFRWSGCN